MQNCLCGYKKLLPEEYPCINCKNKQKKLDYIKFMQLESEIQQLKEKQKSI